MKIGFDTSALDINFKSHAQRGIGRYVSELKRYFDTKQKSSVDIDYFNYTDFFSGALVQPLLAALPAGVNTVRQQLIFPFQLSGPKAKGFDCVHFPAHMDAPAWSAKKCIVTVLDLIPLILKDLYRPEKGNLRFHFARWLEIRAILNASLILAISENTARDVHNILGVREDKIRVTPLGVDSKFFAAELKDNENELRTRYGIPLNRPILLYVGGIDQRKNYRGMMAAFREVLNELSNKTQTFPVLVMAGKIEHDRQYPKLVELIKSLDLGNDVVLAGFVPDRDLLQLYTVSTVFLFLSLYEGFGLPPLEAMAAGLPVISSNTSCMPEILGDAAVLVPPGDQNIIVREIIEVLGDDERRSMLKANGKKRAALFPWSKTGELTLQAYEKIAKRN